MAETLAVPNKRSPVLIGGSIVLVISFLLLVAFGAYLASKGKLFESSITTDAMLFADVPGRIGIDGKLQVEGPAPIPVAAGEHTITFFDGAGKSSLDVAVQKGEFLYIPNPDTPKFYSYEQAGKGAVLASAFPPDTIIKIPNCTPVDYKYPKICEDAHMIREDLSVGTYTIQYSNPNLGDYSEEIRVAANTTIRHTHSFITTLDQWNAWRKQHGEIIERNYGGRYRGNSAGDAILLPFEATGAVFGELFH
jgi:hypothetical protein